MVTSKEPTSAWYKPFFHTTTMNVGGGGMFWCLSQNESPKLLDLGSHQHSLVSQNAFISVPLLFTLSWFLLRVVLPDADSETSRHGQPAQVRHHQQRRYLVNAVPGAHRAYRQEVQAQDVNQCLEQREHTDCGARPWNTQQPSPARL